MHTAPEIIDDDRSEIRAEYDGRQVQGWLYQNDAERREKMRHARSFCDGWLAAMEQEHETAYARCWSA